MRSQTFRPHRALLFLSLLLVSARGETQAQSGRETGATTGRWHLHIETLPQGVPVAHVLLWSPGLNTLTISPEVFDGLPRADSGWPESKTTFKLREDAGTLNFEGSLNGRDGDGAFGFSPSVEFADELVRRGMQRPTILQQFTLARHEIGLDLLEELARNGYATPTTSGLISAGLNGVDTKLVREMAALGLRMHVVDSLTLMHIRGVSPEYIRAMTAAGYSSLSRNNLMAMAVQGVDADFARRMNARAGRQLAPAELVVIRTRGTQ
jgi:hypothetical protein